jgi:hypothetical protein
VSKPLPVVGAGVVGGVEEHVLTLTMACRSRGVTSIVVATVQGEFIDVLLEANQYAAEIAIVETSDTADVAAMAELVGYARRAA